MNILAFCLNKSMRVNPLLMEHRLLQSLLPACQFSHTCWQNCSALAVVGQGQPSWASARELDGAFVSCWVINSAYSPKSPLPMCLAVGHFLSAPYLYFLSVFHTNLWTV